MREIVVDVQHVSKSFGSEQVLEDVTLQLMRGKIHGIIGRNGSGKTVLMKCICGFLRPTAGKISVFGKNIGTDCDFAPKTGMLIETPGFLPHETGMSNLLWLAKLGKGARREDVAALMRLVGLDPAAKKRVSQYSLGMRQRLGIAQALLDAPELLILDEPMNGLDKNGVAEIRALLLDLRAQGKTILLASHFAQDIDALCGEGYEALAEEAKEKGTSAAEFLRQMVTQQKQKKQDFLAQRQAETAGSQQVRGGEAGQQGKGSEDDELKALMTESAAYAKEAAAYGGQMY